MTSVGEGVGSMRLLCGLGCVEELGQRRPFEVRFCREPGKACPDRAELAAQCQLFDGCDVDRLGAEEEGSIVGRLDVARPAPATRIE